MITEGIIKTIDYNGNSCTVRIPLYETVQNLGEVILPGKIAILPGIFNGYKPGDLVWVAFEQDKPHKPIIIGKLYKSLREEASAIGGAVNCTTLSCTGNATLPISSTLTGPTEYPTLKAMSRTVKALEKRLLGGISGTVLPSKYNNILQLNVNNIAIKLYFETNTQYSSVTSLLDTLAVNCNAINRIYPIAHATGYSQQIFGIYVVKTADSTTGLLTYSIYTQSGELLYNGPPISTNLTLLSNDITTI